MENHSIAKLAKEKVCLPPSYHKSQPLSSHTLQGNIAFETKDYGTARSLYSHAMAFDKSNHLYPLNRSQANLKLERYACDRGLVLCRLITRSDGTKPKLTPQKPSTCARAT